VTKDLRKFARQTNLRLLIGFILIVFLIGDGLIYVIYGRDPALLGLVCLFAAVGPVVIIWLILNGFEWIAKRANRNE
jgi:hypothetical protein